MTTVPSYSAADIIGILTNIGNWIFSGALLIAPVMILIGAWMMLSSGGDPTRLASAKKVFLWTAIGLALALLSKGVFVAIQGIFGP